MNLRTGILSPALLTRFERKNDLAQEIKCLVSCVTQPMKGPRSMLQCQVGLCSLSNSFFIWTIISFSVRFLQCLSSDSTKSCCSSSDTAAVTITAFPMCMPEHGHHKEGLADCYFLLREGLALLRLPRR